MPRNYSRKTTRQDWDVEQMKKAVMSVTKGTFGYLKASQVYGVPKSALQDRVNKYKQNNDQHKKDWVGSRQFFQLIKKLL